MNKTSVTEIMEQTGCSYEEACEIIAERIDHYYQEYKDAKLERLLEQEQTK